tara:strand:+ start:7248 stop:7481 length:234 start_codon:yes stop_codon:yes gene_type:complete
MENDKLKRLLIDCADFIQPYNDGGGKAEILMERLDDAIEQVKKLNIDDVSNCLEFIPSTQEGLFCAVCNEHKEYHRK